MDHFRYPAPIGPDGWPVVPEIAPAPGHGREAFNDSIYHRMPLNPARKEIRVLHVKQRRPHPEQPEYYQLQVRLSVVSLLNDPPPIYKALSYVWNDPMPARDAARINDFLKSHHRTLNMALSVLSKDGNELTIWADAFCMNQADDDEKTHQVAMMADIYKNAEEVIAWLGLESPTITRALYLVEEWAEFARRHENEAWIKGIHHEGEQRPWVEKMVLLDEMLQQARAEIPHAFDNTDALGSFAESLRYLSNMTYWNRAWIFQELAFATKCRVQNGERHLSLTSLMSAMKAWEAICEAMRKTHVDPQLWDADMATWTVSTIAKKAGIYDKKFRKFRMYNMLSILSTVRSPYSAVSEKGMMTFQMLMAFSQFDSTDPRDKIFALWGFVDPNGPNAKLIEPDYSLSVEEVYARASRYILLSQENLDTLQYHSHCSKVVNETLESMGFKAEPKKDILLPSWVHDWRFGMENHRSDDIFSSVNTKKFIFPNYQFSDVVKANSNDQLALRLKGFKIGTIKECFTDDDIFPFPLSPGESQMTQIRKLRIFVQNFVQSGQGILCQFLRLLFRGKYPSTFGGNFNDPLDVLTSIANTNPSDSTAVFGKTGMLVLLIQALDSILKMIYSRIASLKDWHGVQLADVSMTVVVLLKLLAEERRAQGEGGLYVFNFGDGILPIVIDSQHTELSDIAQAYSRVQGIGAHFESSKEGPEDQMVADFLSSLAKARKDEAVAGTNTEPQLDEDFQDLPTHEKGIHSGILSIEDDELLRKAIDLILQEDAENDSKSNIQPVAASGSCEIKESTKKDKGDTTTVQFNLQKGAADSRTERAVVCEEDDLASRVISSLEDNSEEEDSPVPVQISPEEIEPESVDDLKDFSWLAEIFVALSATETSRFYSLGVAIEAIMNIKEADMFDSLYQMCERPGGDIWKLQWYHGENPYFFITDNDRLGEYNCCRDLRKEDIAVKFAASETCHILRPLDGGRFSFIATCTMLDLEALEKNSDIESMGWFEIV